MGKIVVVDSNGKKETGEFTECVFNILRVALTPHENETRSVKSLLIDIVKNRQLSRKWKGKLLFRRITEVSNIRTYYTHLRYSPEEDPVATCFIYSIGRDPENGQTTQDKVFMGIFSIKSPEVTELTITDLVEPPTTWLLELKQIL